MREFLTVEPAARQAGVHRGREGEIVATHRTAILCARRRWRLAPEDADDVAQETVLKLLHCKSWPRLIEAWTAVVVRHLVLRGRLRRSSPVLPLGTLPPASFDPRPGLILHHSLGEAFLDLKRAERVLLVGMLAERSHRELAADLGCGVCQIGQRVQRLRAKLRGSLLG